MYVCMYVYGYVVACTDVIFFRAQVCFHQRVDHAERAGGHPRRLLPEGEFMG